MSNKEYLFLGEMYLKSAKILLYTIIESENKTFCIGNTMEEVVEELSNYVDRSDSILLIPAIFNSYQGVELIIKGLLKIRNIEFSTTHDVDGEIDLLETNLGEYKELIKNVKLFYKDQIDILKDIRKIIIFFQIKNYMNH